MEPICVICMCNIESEVITCNNDCRYCSECLINYLNGCFTIPRVIENYIDVKLINCPTCKTGNINQQNCLHSSINETYLKTCCNLIEYITRRKTENESISKKYNVLDPIMTRIKELLTESICCPNKHSFFDFAGCLALTCTTCNVAFCAICLNKCSNNHEIHHNHVKLHMKEYDEEHIKKYGYDGHYFMDSDKWKILREDHQFNAIKKFIEETNIKILWEISDKLIKTIEEEKLLSEETRLKLKNFIFTKTDINMHLVRLPHIYWMILSNEKNIKFEEIVPNYPLNKAQKHYLGKEVRKVILEFCPNWETDKVLYDVPGEDFKAISYPGELLPIIAKAIKNSIKDIEKIKDEPFKRKSFSSRSW